MWQEHIPSFPATVMLDHKARRLIAVFLGKMISVGMTAYTVQLDNCSSSTALQVRTLFSSNIFSGALELGTCKYPPVAVVTSYDNGTMWTLLEGMDALPDISLWATINSTWAPGIIDQELLGITYPLCTVYANHNTRCHFAVAFGCYLGQIWACIVCDESPAKQETWSSWADFAKQAYDIFWNAPINKYNFHKAYNIFKDTHLYHSIWDARIVCGSGNTDMMIDIEECPGCCTGPQGCTYTLLGYELWLPWTSLRPGLHETHKLEIDGQSMWLNKCYDQEIALGDYGEYLSDGSFKHYRNIFENMQELNIDTTGLAYCPDISHVSGCKHAFCHVQLPHDIVMTSGSSGKSLALSRPMGLSLPNNEEFDLLLKALSTHLAGRHLMTTVVQCSELYEVNHEGEWRNLETAWYLLLSDRLITSWGLQLVSNLGLARSHSFEGSPRQWKSICIARILQVWWECYYQPKVLVDSSHKKLLEHIRAFFLNASEDYQQTGQVHQAHYDMAGTISQCSVVDVHSAVQEIIALQMKLHATQDDDEQQALEEDILWFYWCGISSEVDQLLPKGTGGGSHSEEAVFHAIPTCFQL
ncbi:hypothetical protein F5141DRAFT_1067804 [Pisolithus sp. B1]|nr:hypothetical protein F5141DRAFT_1067804 [Pisolithus sp. B1]